MKRYFSTMGMCLAVVLMTSLPNAQAGSKTVTRAWKPLKNIGPAITLPKIQIPQQQWRDSHFQDAAPPYEISAPNVFIKSGIPGTSQYLTSVNLSVCEEGNVVGDVLSRLTIKQYAWNAESQKYENVYSSPMGEADRPMLGGIQLCSFGNQENDDPTHPNYVEFVAPEGAFISRRIVEHTGIPYWNADAYMDLRAGTNFRFYCQTKQNEGSSVEWDAVPESSSAWTSLDSIPYERNTAFNPATRPECGPNATLYKAPGMIGEFVAVSPQYQVAPLTR